LANPFRSHHAAERYAEGRPDVHAEFARRIGRRIVARRILDLGCGTGLSTRALSKLAPTVGLDVSRPMLAYGGGVLGRAESLPFRAASFDLVAMGCMFHWCEPEQLLAETWRVLTSGGHLAVFDHYFAGAMKDEPRFAEWHDGYRRRFAPPPRNPEFDPAHATGFVPIGSERFEHDIEWSQEELVRYLCTQSNVLWAVERGAQGVDAALHEELRALYGARATARLTFAGRLDLLAAESRAPR
jgi:SAM-dependent methyltransferase